MELFTEFYASTYEAYLNDIKTIQEILGNIQDRFVLAEFLQDSLEAEIKTELPSLASQLEQTSYQAWQHWQTLQQRYLNSEIRRNFHSAILHSESE
jgi:CHAD domain-containing protein